jgi:membrane protease YdiL (CAAX protease family)
MIDIDIFNLSVIFFLYLFPIFCIYADIIKYKYRLTVLSIITLVTVLIIVLENWSLADLGIRFDNFIAYLGPYIVFTIGISLLMIVISRKILKRQHIIRWWTNRRLTIGFIPISAVQEFLFRGFLIPVLYEMLGSMFLVIIVNSAIFMFMHVIYNHTVADMLLVFLEGVLLAVMYILFPNLILISLAHAAHNFIAEYYTFFSEDRKPEEMTPFIPPI